jgi:mannose/fructose/N-acetylgalactosamine-specific phosphotransferase system component IIB
LQPSLDIALVRIDNRLIHGQILEAWIPFLKASCIVVVDDQVAADFFRETVIRMAVPSGVKVIISGVAEFAETYRFARGKGLKTIVLFSKISDARTVHRLGFHFDHLNIGNIYNEECKMCCTPAVLLSDADIKDINSLREAGVKIELRRVPREKPIDLFEIVRNMPS